MDIKEILKDTINIEEVANHLGLNLKKIGKDLQGNCPTGHESRSGRCFSVVVGGNFFYCFHCGEGGDIIRLVEIAKEIEFKDALKWLAHEFRPDLLPEIEKNELPITAEEKEKYQKANLFELICEYGKKLLYEPIGWEALSYLINDRGYKEENLRFTEWMYFPKDMEIKGYLAEQYPHLEHQIGQLKLQGYYGDHFRLGFPYRNRRGVILGFGKRSTTPKGITITTFNGKSHDDVRWDSTSGLKKEDLFNLHACRDEKSLIIVEGYPDALYLPALGMKNTVAAAQGILSEKHIAGLLVNKVQRVVISFDNDPCRDGKAVGVENTEKAIELLGRTDIRAFVIDPPLLSPHKDPDEYVVANGIEAFKKLVDNAISASKWKAQRITAKYNPRNDIQREDALNEAVTYSSKMRDPLDSHDFFKTISDSLEIPKNIIERKIKDHMEQKALDQLEKGYTHLLKQAEGMVKERKIIELDEHLTTSSRELRLEFEKIKAKPTLDLSDYLQHKYTLESKRESGLLGYNLKMFKNIARNIDGIQSGFYILAAETNIGKTAFLSNMFLDVLLSNLNVKVIYFSLDDNKDVIINRLLSILSGLRLNQVQRKQPSFEEQDMLRNAYDILIDFSREGRMAMKDLGDVSHIDMLELEIRKRAKDNLVVFIDGLYNLEVGTGFGGLREENIDRANRIKALVDTYKIPVFCTGEIRKKLKTEPSNKPPTIHDIMETGKVAYNANLVWLLYPENVDEFKEKDEPVLILDFAKNKLSHFKGYQKLTFIKRQGLLQEDKGEE